MVDLIYNASGFVLFLFISFILIGFSIITTKLVHRHIPLKFRYAENQAIVCVSAIIGIIYAILIGFTVLYELSAFDKADRSEDEEAKTLFSIFRYSRMLPDPAGTLIRSKVAEYAKYVVENEWPAMASGKHINGAGTQIIESISKQIRTLRITGKESESQKIILNNISIATNSLFDDHEERLARLNATLSPNIWFVLILGTVLTIGINFILGMEYRLHLACVSAISLMISAVVFLMVTLDRPYRGDFATQPDTFKSTLHYINSD